MDEREDRRRRALTIAVGLMREEDSEELASIPRELWTEDQRRRHEAVLQVAVTMFLILEDAEPRVLAFTSAIKGLGDLCRERDVPAPTAEEIALLRERHLTAAAFHRDIEVEQLFDDLREIRRARGA